MTTAIDILRKTVEETDRSLRDTFSVDKPFIHFESGYTPTIVNSLTVLSESRAIDPYPLVAVFTEGLTETSSGGLLEFFVPKIVIAVRAVENLTEQQRLDTSFRQYLHPIFEVFAQKLRLAHYGYDLEIVHSDVPYYTENVKKTSNAFNDMLDGVVVKGLRMKVLPEIVCE